MTCREFAEFLDAFLARTLLAEEDRAFRRHLAVCADCVNYLDTYRRTVDACRQLGADDEQVPADVPEDLVHAILAARRKQA
ncbi:MAG TPA: zf-HC2 domain-containing protein [Planctomycetota bacterium]|nr:zf-HC2 domain-containing protein [Planctomycetota bacterium]